MEKIPDVKNKLNETNAFFLLEKIIPKDESLYLWCYSSSKELVATTCPQAYKLESLFSLFEMKLSLKEYLDQLDTEKPILFGNELGLQWAVTIIKADAKRTLFYAIGPVFYQETNLNALKLALREIKYTHLTITAEEIQKNVPVMPFSVFTRYVLMMHNVLSDTPMELEDLLAPSMSDLLPNHKREDHDHSLVYDNEKALMEMVRKGDLNYQDALKKSIIFSSGVPLKSSEFLRQSKTSAIVFVSLATRAAMEGGLAPTVAYPLGDSYIQAIEESSSQNEIGSLCYAMYHDFILRVHKLHRNPAYSSAINKCCDYIEINRDKKIEVEDLATLVGYTSYYLTEKFKKEVGVSLNTYIKKVKVERAKTLLETTDLPVCEVAEKTAFNTPNYFIQVFRELTGETPVQYRNHKEKKRD